MFWQTSASAAENFTGRVCNKYQSTLSSAGLLRNDDSLSISVARKLKTIKPVIKINGFAIDPVEADLKLSIPKINAIPEI